MMFCCLCRNAESSCHKHFVVVSRQQAPPLTTSDKCHNLPRSCGWSQRWQHASQILESRFLPTPLAFDVPVGGGIPVRILVWKKTRMDGYPVVKKMKICLFVLTECTNVTDRHMHRQTPHDDIGRACTASRRKKLRYRAFRLDRFKAHFIYIVS